MSSYLQRKYAELIYRASDKWVNWDPVVEIRVGAYGSVDKETGDLRVEGNVYDPEFQVDLDRCGIKMNMTDFLPREGPVGDDFIVTSRGAKRRDSGRDQETHSEVAGITNASVRGQWSFKYGKRDAILIMHKPRQISLPTDAVLEPLYQVDKLINKWLVTSIYVCPAYCMYLSDKLCDNVSLALVPQTPVTEVAGVHASATAGFAWWADNHTGYLRKACNTTGNCPYTPLFAVKRPVGRTRKARFESKLSNDDLWYTPFPPWDPLDEDGEEDPIDDSMQDIEPM